METKSLTEIVNLAGKVAIVTGGAMGIGYGIAYRLAEAGASLMIADMNKEATDTAVAQLSAKGWKVSAFAVDVSQADQVNAMIAQTVATYGAVDIFVNNAGIYPNIPVMQMEEKDFDRVIAVNLKSAYLCMKAVATQMIAQARGGKMIVVTSIDSLHPSMIGLAAYDASKHGLLGFVKNIALELAPHNIQINTIAPGAIATPGTGSGKMTEEQLNETMKPFIEKTPMHRLGMPDDIGKVALFLASDLSSYMTGSQVVVDGGILLK